MGLMDTAGAAVKFVAPGVHITGTVRGVEEYTPTVYGTNEPKTTRSGKVVTGYRIDMNDDDGEALSLYVEKWRMLRAIQDAVRAAGARDLEPGGVLTVTRGDDVKGGGAQAAQTFTATYAPPSHGGGAPVAAPGPAPASPQRPVHIPQAVWDMLSPQQQADAIDSASDPAPF